MSNTEYEFKVNGTGFSTENRILTALEILTIAKRGGAIANNPERYALRGDKGEYQGTDRVDLAEDNVFITAPIGPTPVA